MELMISVPSTVHRSLLCGSCQSGLSLSLGSSRCLPCPSYWPALLIAITIVAILAGITLELVLNITVAVGTLNGLIFYANVVYANKSILLPFQETNFITVFISWLNLELGIDTCCFPEMDIYTKTWLQLAFPAYVILLVVLVIIISSYSSKFSNLIGKKDPVATLATLICSPILSFLKSALNLYQLALLNILMAQVKGCGSLMQPSNISLENTFFYSLLLFSFSWLVWSTLLFSSCGSGYSNFQDGEFLGGQGIQKYKLLLKPTTHLTLPSIATGLDCC